VPEDRGGYPPHFAMSRRAAIITQADVARAIRAAQQCGAGSVEIRPDGTIRVVICPESTIQPTDGQEPSLEPEGKVVL
jgi:hypothetical protein